ncbi:MAG: hypothetical protein EXQ97_00060 [Alphaproteobacteria bacterium]|nr:hypothetical protein [Alphaproteobacteria bacterium]
MFTVAMDADAEAARPFIEGEKPTHVSVNDRDHVVSGLFNMVNVPQAVWIDETGHIVSPVEIAGVTEAFRDGLDRTTGTMAPAVIARNVVIRHAYVDAIRDWVEKGAASRNAIDSGRERELMALLDDRIEEAHVQFRFAQALLRRGRESEAQGPVERARTLHPQSWTIWRQTSAKNALGLASHAELFARIDATAPGGFYPPVDMDGLP